MNKIIKIIIDSNVNPIASLKYSDRLEINSNSISYVRAYEEIDSYEWNYNTNSNIFENKFIALANSIIKYFKKDEECINPSFTIYLLFNDGNIKEKSFGLTLKDNNMLDFMFLLKDMIPNNEELPDYFYMEAFENSLLEL